MNRIVAHFQNLFEVKALEGVFPKMNEVFVANNEMKNFIKSLKALLQIGRCLYHA